MSDVTIVQQNARNMLDNRIENIERLIQSTRTCLVSNDYFQAAVRISEIRKFIEFDNDLMKILESLSENE